MGRATQGVKLIDLGKRGDTIASVCKVDSQPEEELENELEAESEENRIERAEDRVIREAEEILDAQDQDPDVAPEEIDDDVESGD